MFDRPENALNPDDAGRSGPDTVRVGKLVKCGICSREFELSSSQYRPFCSQRCQQVDLGKWLNESYGLPFEDSAVPDMTTGIEDPFDE